MNIYKFTQALNTGAILQLQSIKKQAAIQKDTTWTHKNRIHLFVSVLTDVLTNSY